MRYDVIIAFMIVAKIFAIATLIYVLIDLILELLKRKKREEEPEQEPEPEQEQEEEPLPPVVLMNVPLELPPEALPEIVDHIVAEEADELISDDLAMKYTKYEEGAGQGKQGIINIGVIDKHFNDDDTITLQALKDKGLVPKKIGRIKVLADGILNKSLTIKAEDYSVQAIKMIELTGGTVIILKD